MDVDLIVNVARTWHDNWVLGLVHASFFLFSTIFIALLGTTVTRMADGQRIGGSMFRFLAISLALTLAAGCTTYTIVILPEVQRQEAAQNRSAAEQAAHDQQRAQQLATATRVLTGSWRPLTAANCNEALTFAVNGEKLTVTTPGGVATEYTIGAVVLASETVPVSSDSGERTVYQPQGRRLREITTAVQTEYEKCGA